ncbi:MAG: hypothetical protein IKS33_03465 [Bacteroidales bacterium]|nr:hypothetical protein [Bacteroidales bacterium]MBR4453302.1 hypothetical protein [Bacteroidales bacterium]MCR5555756.1 plasmid pRiA4b ORF-3 family protein [Bacteroidales bacterium]
MYVYKFRMTSDEIEGFTRDYEIAGEQTFQDFHDVIISSIKGYNQGELSSFFIADGQWAKKKEITLVDMNVDEDSEKEMPKYVMKDAKIKDFIDDPHQKLIFEYDYLNHIVYYIELLKLVEVDDKKKNQYPICTNSVGDSMPLKKIDDFLEDLSIDDEDLDEGFSEEFDDEFGDETEI